MADPRAVQAPWWPLTEAWLAESGPAMALAVNNAACLLDLESVILDGSFTRQLLAALQAALDRALDGYSGQGVTRPAVLPQAPSAPTRGRWAAHCCPCMPTFRPTASCF